MKRNRLYSAMMERKSDNDGGGGSGESSSLGTLVKEIKNTLDGYGKTWEEMKTELKRLEEAKASGKSVTDIEEKLSKIGEKLDTYSTSKTTLEKSVTELQSKLDGNYAGDPKKAGDIALEVKAFNLQRRTSLNNNSIPDVTADQYQDYKNAFLKMVRRGEDRLSETEKKAMIAGDDANGGYFLPASTVGRVVARLFEISPMRDLATVVGIQGPALEGVYDNDESGFGWVSETDPRPATTTPTIGAYRIEAFEMYANPAISQTLLDDAGIDIEAWLANKIATKFARVEGAAFVNGTGVGQPRGFTTYPMNTTSDDTRLWGTIQYVKTGVDGAFSTDGNPLFDLLAAFRPAYLNNAQWLTRREVIAAIRKLKGTTNGDYLWQPGLQQGVPDRLLGYPVRTDQNIPAIASQSFSMWLGDWKEAYTIVDRMGIRTLRDPYTNKPYVMFYSTKRVGGAVLNFEALKAMKFYTS